MRRLLRDVAENRALGDTTTLADPSVVNELAALAAAEAANGRGVGADRTCFRPATRLQPQRVELRREPFVSRVCELADAGVQRDERGQVLGVRE